MTMKKTLSLLTLAAALLTGCQTAPKLDANGQPPPGWILLPKTPGAF